MTKDGCRINHLLFKDDLMLFAKNEKKIDSLVQIIRIFNDDISCLEKCAAITMTRSKRVHSDRIALPDGTQLRVLGKEQSYEYLGVLEADNVLEKESKERLKKEYTCTCIRRVKKCLKSKLNGRNMDMVLKGNQHFGCVTNDVQCRRLAGKITSWPIPEMYRRSSE